MKRIKSCPRELSMCQLFNLWQAVPHEVQVGIPMPLQEMQGLLLSLGFQKLIILKWTFRTADLATPVPSCMSAGLSPQIDGSTYSTMFLVWKDRREWT